MFRKDLFVLLTCLICRLAHKMEIFITCLRCSIVEYNNLCGIMQIEKARCQYHICSTVCLADKKKKKKKKKRFRARGPGLEILNLHQPLMSMSMTLSALHSSG